MDKHGTKKKKETIIREEDDKKSIILILIAILAVIALIITSVFLFDEEKEAEGNKDGDEVELIDVIGGEDDEDEDTVALGISKKIIVKYLDIEGNQLGKTQKLVTLEDRTNERAPKIEGYRFSEWVMRYDKTENVYYFYPVYIEVVEKIEAEEDKLIVLNEENVEDNNYVVTITDVRMPGDELLEGEEAVENPTYEVEITGEVALLSDEEKSDELTINEIYDHIIGLRINAPEDVTKENIENMAIEVSATNPEETLNPDEYHYNGEDVTKTGRDLLDSTDEEYENNIFYFYYYQEVDTKKDATLEVYWGNDPDADSTSDPIVEPKEEYVEHYNVNVENVELEVETLLET